MLEPREYSRRLGVLTHEQMQEALARFGLGELIDAEPAPGGLFGQIVLLTTSKGGYALRGHPHPGQVERERYVAELIHAGTSVPVPHPYLVDDTTDIFGWEYAIMPRLPGVHLADGEVRREFSDADRLAIVEALAECLADLHAAAFDRPAFYSDEGARFEPIAKDYATWFGDWTRWWLDRCRAASDATTDDDVAWVNEVIDDAHGALAQPSAAAFVHTDFKEGNAVAERIGDRWRISGVFDLAETYAGDGEYDLARAYCEYLPRRPELARAYVRRYLSLRPPHTGFAARFRHYVLHDRLIIWEYAQRNGVWVRPGQSLRSWAEAFLVVPDLAGVAGT